MLDLFNFHTAWSYLDNHMIFSDRHTTYPDSMFQQCLDIEIVKVNPKTDSIDDDKTLNTKVQIWLEAGPYLGRYFAHDIDLDCGGDTFEETIIELASLVKQKYGDNPEVSMKIVQENHGDLFEK